jgi:hypothetical protein
VFADPLEGVARDPVVLGAHGGDRTVSGHQQPLGLLEAALHGKARTQQAHRLAHQPVRWWKRTLAKGEALLEQRSCFLVPVLPHA